VACHGGCSLDLGPGKLVNKTIEDSELRLVKVVVEAQCKRPRLPSRDLKTPQNYHWSIVRKGKVDGLF
jgi:hypothetical protein